MRIIVYARVSTTGQENGASLEAQRACVEECERRGWTVADVVRDISRPGLQEALCAATSIG